MPTVSTPTPRCRRDRNRPRHRARPVFARSLRRPASRKSASLTPFYTFRDQFLEANSFRDDADRGSYRRPRGRASQLTRRASHLTWLVWLLRGPYEDLVYSHPLRLGNDVDDCVGDVLGLEGIELLEQGA